MFTSAGLAEKGRLIPLTSDPQIIYPIPQSLDFSISFLFYFFLVFGPSH